MAGTATVTTTSNTGNVWIDGLICPDKWTSGGGTTVISVAFAGLSTQQTLSWTGGSVTAYEIAPSELAAMKLAMQLIANVANIRFDLGGSGTGVGLNGADVIWASVDNTDAEGNLGWAYQPGTIQRGGQDISIIAMNWEAYNPAFDAPNAVVQGGYDFCTFIHELGHALGLDHTFDGSPVWPGVGAAFDDLGNFNMNQGIYTMMGYNDGWQTGPLPVQAPADRPTYGWQATPMAFDIAALQAMYGVNTTFAAGNSTYTLPGANGVGTFFSCIWDAGGTDVILGAGGIANTVDLRAATLRSEVGGGGWVSWAQGIYGGFTIANGVVIENARGGSLGDTIRGNQAANRLEGLGGQDSLWGGDGADRLLGGGGNDRLEGQNGADSLVGGDGADTLLGGGAADTLLGGGAADRFVFSAASDSTSAARDLIVDFLKGTDRIVLSGIDANGSAAGFGRFQLDTGGSFAVGEIRQIDTGPSIRLEMNIAGNATPEMVIVLQGVASPLSVGDFILA